VASHVRYDTFREHDVAAFAVVEVHVPRTRCELIGGRRRLRIVDSRR
jgi:hypothetical protein